MRPAAVGAIVVNACFIHGLDSSSRGSKGTYFRSHFPDMLVPDFDGPFAGRMVTLYQLLAGKSGLILVGSSFGGLMATVFAIENAAAVRRLILLAPALNFPEFTPYHGRKTVVPATIYLGRRDTVTPPGQVRPLAVETFASLLWHETDDDHLLRCTFPRIDWPGLLAPS